jgi:soluble lytic murein transglycosylase-like protein
MIEIPLEFSQDEARWLVEEWAKKYELDPVVVAAVVLQESAGNPWAIRYEPNYRWLYPAGGPLLVPRGVSEATEVAQQKTSFGLMQVLGAVAREHGCADPFLTVLCQPAKGLEYGCRHLAKQKKRWPATHKYLAAYNAGRPDVAAGMRYAAEVAARAERLREGWR